MAAMADKSKKTITFPKFDGPRPDFNKPPVTEVVLSLQFEPILGFKVPHYGLLWDRFREKKPITATKGILPPVFEQFGPPQTSQTIRFEVLQDPGVPRCWFENIKGTELIQVQQDRFIFNWKSGNVGQSYPRYEKVRARFRTHFRVFETFIRENEMGEIVPNQCEVTYVNEINAGEGWARLGKLGSVFSVWSGRFSDGFLAEPEDAQFRFSQRILSAEGEPIGRLHASVEPRYRADDGSPILRFVLTARGAPIKPTKKAVFSFFDLAREYVVRGFASSTTKRMHTIWERNDVK